MASVESEVVPFDIVLDSEEVRSWYNFSQATIFVVSRSFPEDRNSREESCIWDNYGALAGTILAKTFPVVSMLGVIPGGVEVVG